MNALTYIEEELNCPLWPVQRVVVKLTYGLPLDKKKKCIPIRKAWNRKPTLVTEQAYVTYLYEVGRCNTRTPNPKGYRFVVLPWGRRTGKSMLGSLLQMYELHRLIELRNPHKSYGIPHTTPINMLTMSPTRDMAQLARAEMEHLTAKDPSTLGLLQDSIAGLITYKTLHWLPDSEGIEMQFGAGSQNQKNPPAHILNAWLRFDEMAHINNADLWWRRLLPTTDLNKAKILAASSPKGKKGQFYYLYKETMGRGSHNSLVLQAPSWEVNPHFEYKVTAEMRRALPKSSFDAEFGAEFI